MADYLPREVVVDILARLSIREIVKCRSVCKSWYSLISSTAFQSYHLNSPAKGNRSLILFRHDVDEDGKIEHYSLCIDDDDFPRTVIQEFESPFKGDSFRISSCCNGVICFTGFRMYVSVERAVLWNPCIRKIVEIPPPILAHESHKQYADSVGFGYDAVNDDYKLVRVSVHALKGQLIEVYSWRSGFWRMVDHRGRLNSLIRDGSSAVHIDGICYWIASRRKPGFNNMIVSLALDTEVFGEMPVPDDDLVEKYHLGLSSLCNGLLSLVLHENLPANMERATIWVMKEGAWMKLFVWETSHVLCNIIDVKDNGVALFIVYAGLFETEERLVRSYDWGKGEEVDLAVQRKMVSLSTLVFYQSSYNGNHGRRFLFSCALSCCYDEDSLVECLESDREALIDFKNGLQDPANRLISWRGSNCCEWAGIACDNKTGAVVSVDLRSWDSSDMFVPGKDALSGEIRPSLGNLKSLKHFDLSLNEFDGNFIPEFFDTFKDLEYLNLANAGFCGVVPTNLGNISTLQYLNLSSLSSYLKADSLEWLEGLSSLRVLVLDGVNLSEVGSSWLRSLDMLQRLTVLHLPFCKLNGYSSHWHMKNLTSLADVNIRENNVNLEFPYWLANISSLVSLDVRHCNLHGSFPFAIGEMPNLRFLHLAGNPFDLNTTGYLFSRTWRKLEALDLAFTGLRDNQLSGNPPIPAEGREYCHGNGLFSNMENLLLANNLLGGELPGWLVELRSLVKLRLESNLFQGSIPASFGALSNLRELGLGNNQLNGTLPESLSKLSNLAVLDVSFNHLTGVVSEAHFSKMDLLSELRLSSNSIILNISSSWVPNFQLRRIDLGSCQVGPSFPLWLESQRIIIRLDLSNNSISDDIPSWFWDIIGEIGWLNLSMNHIRGQLPSMLHIRLGADIDFSLNQFEGSIPLSFGNPFRLNLSNNKLSGTIPETLADEMPYLFMISLSANHLGGEIPSSIGKLRDAEAIDLSDNNFIGSIPPRLGNCRTLQFLDLRNNNLSGVIPDSLGHLISLRSLHLRNNMLTGVIPWSFRNLSSIQTLDLGNNKLTGELPLWIGQSLGNLRILVLRSNTFSGKLPSTLSMLSSLLVLDLSENQLSGRIPASYESFKAMAQEQGTYLYWSRTEIRNKYYEEKLVVNVKGLTLEFTKTLSFLTCIDLSGNKLHGEIPSRLTQLIGLVVLNLSRNHFNGTIPAKISNLSHLSSLDLSSNAFSGPIPSTMAELSFMGYLNLSKNKFSGKIPFNGQLTTFEASSFAGNPSLCGPPLVTKCSDNGSSELGNTGTDEDIDKMLYLCTAVGFAVGMSIPFYIFAFRSPWRDF
ncbi:Receptor-like protein EIX2 [Linum perenne]